MTVTYTGNLKLGLPTTGTESGTWGDVINNQITTLVDQSISGTVSLTSMTNADYTLTNGNGNAANEARYMALLVPSSLTLTAARNIIVPSTSKMYVVRNSSTGGFLVTVKTAAGSGVGVPNGSTLTLYCDGTNVGLASDAAAAGTVTSVAVSGGTTGLTTSGGPITNAGTITLAGTLAVANGGTGSTTLAANNVLLGNGTSALQVVAPGTSGNVLTSNGTTWSSTALPSASVTSVNGVTGAVVMTSEDVVGCVMCLTYATVNTSVTSGTTYAGSGLRRGGIGGFNPFEETTTLAGTACSGTWRCMGTTNNSGTSTYSRSLFVRIS